MPESESRVECASFHSSDVAEVEQFFGAAYTQMSISVPADRDRFWFRHDTAALPTFSINRMVSALSFVATVPSMGGRIIVDHMVSGGLGVTSRGSGDVRTARGGTLLGPTDEDFQVHVQECDMEIVTMDMARLEDYAAHMCGTGPGELEFTGVAPLSDDRHRHWLAAVAHVRDGVLVDPFASSSPIIVESSFRTLAAALLSTYPNTGLAAVTDPEGPGVRGDVPVTVLREVMDYLASHADRPVGPGDMTELAGMPARDIVEGLRRRFDVHPAQLLWAARLRGVHRSLIDADPEQESVRDLATRWGFGNIGRFRVAYRCMFSESPETTLQR